MGAHELFAAVSAATLPSEDGQCVAKLDTGESIADNSLLPARSKR